MAGHDTYVPIVCIFYGPINTRASKNKANSILICSIIYSVNSFNSKSE